MGQVFDKRGFQSRIRTLGEAAQGDFCRGWSGWTIGGGRRHSLSRRGTSRRRRAAAYRSGFFAASCLRSFGPERNFRRVSARPCMALASLCVADWQHPVRQRFGSAYNCWKPIVSDGCADWWHAFDSWLVLGGRDGACLIVAKWGRQSSRKI